MFKVLAAIHITIITMLAVNSVGTVVNCASGKPVTVAIPVAVFVLLLFTLGLGIGIASEYWEEK